MLIYETKNFTVEAEDHPLVDRADGGHVAIYPKVRVSTRQQLSPALAIELIRLTMVVGEAMALVMNDHGVDIGRINYQDNGNWSVFSPEGPTLHIHLFGRAKSAKVQLYGQALYFRYRKEYPEFYEGLAPLTEEDCEGIRERVIEILKGEKFRDGAWGLAADGE